MGVEIIPLWRIQGAEARLGRCIMSVRTIVINDKCKVEQPTVKLAAAAPSSVWQYVGFCLNDIDQGEELEDEGRDLNRAVQVAAGRLAEKVSGREISIEVVIEPLIPLTNVTTRRLVPLIAAIGENASASVEPGPGTVLLKTWWGNGLAGVDAIGIDGYVPEAIKINLMKPGFTTRVAEWDTGLGLHQASEAAAEIDGKIEVFEPSDQRGIGFRFAFVLKSGTPIDCPETRVGLVDLDERKPELTLLDNGWYFPTISEPVEVGCHVNDRNQIEA